MRAISAVIALSLLTAMPAGSFAAGDQLAPLNLENPNDIRVPLLSAAEPVQKGAPVICGDADMSEFFRRLESIGLDTKELRRLTRKLDVRFDKQGAGAAAEYGYILKNLYLSSEYNEKNSNRLRFDLEPYDINTIIHEYAHAARDIFAAADAPKGSPARGHYDAVQIIRADLRSQALYYRYSLMKADEVAAYFMGNAVGTLFDAVGDIVSYNTVFAGAKPATVAEAEALGGRLLLPAPGAPGWGQLILRDYARFGRNSVYEDAMFKDNMFSGFAPIHWEERQFVKDDMWKSILGLYPPGTVQELVDRLNTLDNEWIRGVRAKVAAVRLANAQKAQQR